MREYCGHGIGRGFHEDPQVLHYGTAGTGAMLTAGMTFTIEPMVNAGKRDVRLLPDGWTVVTRDHSLSAQWEHTILVTETGFEVLTLGASERAPAAPDHAVTRPSKRSRSSPGRIPLPPWPFLETLPAARWRRRDGPHRGVPPGAGRRRRRA